MRGFSRSWGLIVVLIVLAGLVGGLGTDAPAADAKALLKQANKELRQAQKDMFAGKKEQAIASLDSIRNLLSQAKEADPNSPRLKSALNKYKKLVKDLERRTGQDLGGGTLTATKKSSETKLPPKPQAKESSTPTKLPPKPKAKAASDSTKLPPKPQVKPLAKKTDAGGGAPAAKSDKLPYHARQAYKQASRSADRIDSYIAKLNDSNYPGDKEQAVRNAQNNVEQAKKGLAEAKARAAEEGVTTHPKFDELEAKIAAAEKRLAAAATGHQEAQAAASAKLAELKADVKVLMDEYQRHDPLFSKATGVVIYYNDLKPVKELIGLIEAFEKNDKAGCQEKLKAFAAKYGSTKEEIDKAADAAGYSANYRASYAYTEISQGLANIAQTRTVMADDLVRKAQAKQENSTKGLHDFFRVKNYSILKDWGGMAARYDPQNPRVKEFLGGLDGWIKQDMAALNAKVDKAKMPAQAADAPANAKKLAKVSLDFLSKEAQKAAAAGKSKRTIEAVVVTGNWKVFKKNILGEPIQWWLPITWAETWEVEKDKDLVRVYGAGMLTQEFKGVKKAPPFIGATVGDSYYIRRSQLK